MDDQTATEPQDPQERIIVRLDRLIQGVEAGGAAVAAETAAREAAMSEERQRTDDKLRSNRHVMAAVAIGATVALLVGGWVGYDRATRNDVTCTEKLARADVADQRVIIATDTLAASEYVKMPPADRRTLTADLAEALNKLPPPC